MVPLDEDVQKEMFRHAVDNLQEALNEGADAVVFPEFALPPVDVSDKFPDIRDFNPFDSDDQAVVDEKFEEIRDQNSAGGTWLS